jgi:multiple sugar transport system permease protein
MRSWQRAILHLPALAHQGVFLLYPLAAVIGYSLTVWDGFSAPRPTGLANYEFMLQAPGFWRSVGITGLAVLMQVPPFVALSAVIAIEIEGSRLERAIKAVLFLPFVISISSATAGWYTLYGDDYGAIRELTGLFIPWGSQPWAGLLIVSLFTIWRNLGFGVLVVSAAVKQVPREVLEAAVVDGATLTRLRWSVVLPLISPAVVFATVIATIFSIQSYSAILLLTNGGPIGGTQTLPFYMYLQGQGGAFRLGYAAAIMVVTLLLTFAVAIWQTRIVRKVFE